MLERRKTNESIPHMTYEDAEDGTMAGSREPPHTAGQRHPTMRDYVHTALFEPAGGPTIVVPLLVSMGMCVMGPRWLLFGGAGGRMLGVPFLILGPVSMRLWWRSFRRKVQLRLKRESTGRKRLDLEGGL